MDEYGEFRDHLVREPFAQLLTIERGKAEALLAEVEKLRRVRDAAQAVAAALREHIPRCACTVCGLRAALDAAKSGEDVEVDDGTHQKSKA